MRRRLCGVFASAFLVACATSPRTDRGPSPTQSTLRTGGPQEAIAIPTDAAGAPFAMVWMGEHYFAPSTLTIPVGTTVMWRMLGQQEHDVWALDAGDFHSPTMGPGATYSHTFTKAGTFKYTCIPHGGDGMHGEVIVIPRPGG